MAPSVRSLDHLVLTVRDIATTIGFYVDVLGMKPLVFEAADGTNRSALTFGIQKINLHQLGAEFEPKAHRATAGSADLCLLSDDALSQWIPHLETNGCPIEQGPIARSGATGPITSIYIRDPDGNLIEISNKEEN